MVLLVPVESAHVAPFWQGLLAHSSTSILQLLPNGALLSSTLHCAVYSLMNAYAQAPFAKPGAQAHEYARIDIVESALESVRVPPLKQGELMHSSTSTSQYVPFHPESQSH